MSDDERAADRWQNEGGKVRPATHYMTKDLTHLEDNPFRLLPPFEHKEPPNDDDVGLPEHPIYSNYVKYLWKGHRRSGGPEVPQVSIRPRIGESKKAFRG